jgi:MerR family transcriptional regulator, copper efflux regulator
VRRLVFIRRCREFGFSIEQVRDLVRLVDHPELPCTEVREIAAGHLVDVRRKLDELRALEAGLATFVDRCDSACAGGASVDCTILEDLAMPAEDARIVKPRSCCGG